MSEHESYLAIEIIFIFHVSITFEDVSLISDPDTVRVDVNDSLDEHRQIELRDHDRSHVFLVDLEVDVAYELTQFLEFNQRIQILVRLHLCAQKNLRDSRTRSLT